MHKKDLLRDIALQTLQAIAQDPKASQATRMQASKAILGALAPVGRPSTVPRARPKGPAVRRTPAELREQLALIRAKKPNSGQA